MMPRFRVGTALLALSSLLIASQAAGDMPVRQPTRTVESGAVGTTLTIYGAASLTAFFTDLGKVFEAAHPGTKVVFNFAGSQELRAQLEQGARADIFASADTRSMENAQAKGLIQGTARIFGRNRLIIIAPKDNPAGVKDPKDLAKVGLKLDIADASVPVGSYTLQVLDKLAADPSYGTDFKTKVLAKVVSRESNVKQVVSKVSLGEADAGVVYTTDAHAAAGKVAIVDIPDQLNVIATYSVAVLKETRNVALARAFINALMSGDGQATMSKYGFAAP